MNTVSNKPKNYSQTLKENLAYVVRDGKYVYEEMKPTIINDRLDKIKNKVKNFPKLYYFIVQTISPVCGDNNAKLFIADYKRDDSIILNVGSGNSNINPHVINVDIFAYENVDVVCDIEKLPFKDNSVDAVLNTTVLEHVPYPEKVIKEIHRILKPGGAIYTAFPFMQGFHASPYDFSRLTSEGIKLLHCDFDIIETKPFGGPTSGMLWVLQEWLAIIFSFGSTKLHLILSIFFMLITWPIKFLDLLLKRHPSAINISSGFICIGKKRG